MQNHLLSKQPLPHTLVPYPHAPHACCRLCLSLLHPSGASGQYELVTEQLLPTEALAALERRDPDEEAAAAEVSYSATALQRRF